LESQVEILQSLGKAFEKDAAKAVALLDDAKSENTHLQQQLSILMGKCAVEAQQTMEKATMLKAKLAASKTENRNLKQHCARIPEIKARAIKHAVKSANKEKTFKLVHKGVYGPQARALARTLVAAKCLQEYVGSVIFAVCKTAGVAVQGKMSRRTVARANLEGGVAAQIQAGYELAKTKCELYPNHINRKITNLWYLAFTASGDGTSNKHINYDARHVHIKVSDSASGSEPKHKSRFLGLHSAADQSAEQSVEDWLNTFSNILDVYTQSPLAKRSKHFTRLVDIMSKLMGMNADHCKKEKKIGHRMEEKKITAV
jgi:hypothetical protein